LGGILDLRDEQNSGRPMDSDELFSTVPTLHRWRGMFDADKKQFTENLIRAIIESIVKDKREPNAEEARDIWAAIGALASRNYTASLDYARAASMAQKEPVPLEDTRVVDAPTVGQLLDALNYVAVGTA
jgi:hypothetical protein